MMIDADAGIGQAGDSLGVEMAEGAAVGRDQVGTNQMQGGLDEGVRKEEALGEVGRTEVLRTVLDCIGGAHIVLEGIEDVHIEVARIGIAGGTEVDPAIAEGRSDSTVWPYSALAGYTVTMDVVSAIQFK